MKWRYRFYAMMSVLWIFLMVGAFFVIDAGVAESYVPASMLPKTRGATILVTAGSAVVGVFVFGKLRIRTWRSIGRRAGLTADDSSIGPLGLVAADQTGGALFELFPLPDLTGTVDGRDVRVTSYSVSRGGSGDSSTGSKTYTVVEAELANPPAENAMVAPTGKQSAGGVTEIVPGKLEATVVEDGFEVLGTGNEAFARQILSGSARESLLALEKPGTVFVGNPSDVLTAAVPDEVAPFAEMITGNLEEKLEKYPTFDPGTVALSTRGRTLNPAELERKAQAVVRSAASVEHASAETATT